MVTQSQHKTRIVLLDAHAIIHRAYHALPTFFSSKGQPTGALYGICTMLMKIGTDLRPDYVIACYDLPKPTFRHIAYKEYKEGRQKADETLVAQLESSREVFKAFSVPVYEAAGFEADDVLGTIVEQLKDNIQVEIIIASGDMDTMQLIDGKKVQVYTLKKGIHDTILYDEIAIVKRFGFSPLSIPDYKGLAGDSSDNIIGIKGIGEKTATTLISAFGTIEKMYKTLHANEEDLQNLKITPRMIGLLRGGEEEALFSKTLATIRRDVPITFTLPSLPWKETVNVAVVDEMLVRFEFRSLKARIDQLFVHTKNVVIQEDSNKKETSETIKITEVDFEEASILTWLLNADKTNPKEGDILEVAGKGTFREALEVLRERVLREESFKKLFLSIEKPLSPVLRKMKEVGILLDTSYLEVLRTAYVQDIQNIETEIYALAGKGFNISSPKQIGEVLFGELKLEVKGVKKTAGGAYSTNIETLHKLEKAHPIVPLIMKHREAEKMLSTYIVALPKLVGEDGRIHTQFLQTGASTGRLSSKDPNMQNIPTTEVEGKNVRRAFISGTGKTFVSFDYSQIELRVAAILSGDRALCAIFEKGEDVHSAVAKEVYGVTDEGLTKEMRRHAKAINFGILYGMGVSSLKESLCTDRKTAQDFYDAYKKSFGTLMVYLEQVKIDAEANGYTETLFGRRRPMPLLRSHLPFMKAQGQRMAINAPIQGTAADIMRLATVDVQALLEKEGLEKDVALLLQIHDELVLEVSDKSVVKIIPIIKTAMEQVLIKHRLLIEMKEIPNISLVVGVHVGKTLGDLKTI